MVEELFKLTLKLKEVKAFKTLSSASYYISEAILTEDQNNQFPEMPNIIKNVIEQITKKTQENRKVDNSFEQAKAQQDKGK